MDREEERLRGVRCAAELSARDIRAVALTWVDNAGATPDGTPAGAGSAYGMNRLIAGSDHLADLLETLDLQGVPVDQPHPEYSPGQFELSVAATGPGVASQLRLVPQRWTY